MRQYRSTSFGALELVPFVVAFCAASLSGPEPANAEVPAATLEQTQVLGGLRYGTDKLSVGFGARGGYTLSNRIYVGGSFDYFLGEDEHAPVAGVETEIDYSVWVLLAEGGYDFGLHPNWVLRPMGGLGLAVASGEACVTVPFGGGSQCQSRDDSDLALSLGGLLHYVHGALLVGPEFKILVADDIALVVGAHAGGRF
jgi:hypothetical protein